MLDALEIDIEIPHPQETPDPVAVELGKWQKKALRLLESSGNAASEAWKSDIIPQTDRDAITDQLKQATTPEQVRSAWSNLESDPTLKLCGSHAIAFTAEDISFEPRTRLPGHPNAMTLRAFGEDALPVFEQTYYSVGGGFIRRDGEEASSITTNWPLPYATSEA
jgi:hypothetical protein